ncbi:EAL domain-containing protein [uncultured Roseobacter sp.]|uniref:putative bifunctional diguanylate cyclase/phosphodiesterase n=1 Tax=uncultured Roseobacter sp. TaxID=114847 RepID=UPI00260813CE|nr:EAL domain-containing protein [uncultured Roseobacter sp.]
MFPLAALVGFVCAIVFGVHLLIDRAINQAIKSHADMDAMTWARELHANLLASDGALSSGMLTEDQKAVIDAAIKYGNVYAFIVYDTKGRMVYSSDYGAPDLGTDRPVNETAQEVVTSGASNVQVLQRMSPAGDQSVFVDAFVPAKGQDGRVIGAVQVYLDKSEIATFYHSFLDWIGLLLPVVCAVIYVVPSVAFVMKREQAFSRGEDVRQLSRYDALTGALNRHTMSTEAKKRFADRGQDTQIGVFFLDIDKFKTVNDTHGHEFGDAYLKHIASILIASVRETDLVGRMGGDEFVVCFPDACLNLLERVGQKMMHAANQPFEYKGKTIQGSLSIGAHLADPDESGPEALHAADLALYHAKSTGRNKMQVYFKALDTALLRRCEVEARMRQAFDRNEFEVHFQPLSKPSDGSIIGFEALLRLNGTDGAPISPTEFIPIAEETGMIQALGMRTLRQAIETAKTWPEDIFLSVNLSPAQFQKGDLVSEIEALLNELNFPAGRLELEVTENLLMADEERVSAQLVGLKRMGISIAMDDFGTGYSSLGYLWKYDFDKLKIDRVFLEGFEFDNLRYREIIETIVTLGHKMGMQVTVEGVENEAQTEMLDEFACDQYQGFLIGKPMPAAQALETINAERPGETSAA